MNHPCTIAHCTTHIQGQNAYYSMGSFVLLQIGFVLGLKGQCHEIFETFFIKILHLGPHINRQKRFREIFSFCKDIREKRVRVVIDYAHTLATKSLTMPTRCQPGHLQYADTMSA